MNEIIRKRKSVRKYDMAQLDASDIEKVNALVKNVKPLYPDIAYTIEMVNKTKGLFNVKAPHYLIFGSEEKDGAYENIGFIGQQLDLFLSEAGFGTCWLGASKPEDKSASKLPYVIALSIGKPAESLHREISEFHRKALGEISEGTDERLEAARLAPSGMNLQGWYFLVDSGKIHCFRKKSLLEFKNKLGRIDMGIAICHLATESESFSFSKESNIPVRKGYEYSGTVGANKTREETTI